MVCNWLRNGLLLLRVRGPQAACFWDVQHTQGSVLDIKITVTVCPCTFVYTSCTCVLYGFLRVRAACARHYDWGRSAVRRSVHIPTEGVRLCGDTPSAVNNLFFVVQLLVMLHFREPLAGCRFVATHSFVQ